MFVYLSVGLLTTLFAYLFDRTYDKNKVVSYVFIILFVLFPSLVEGCRDPNVGTDMMGYGASYFYDSLKYASLKSFLSDLTTKEYAYHLLCYFCGKAGNINLYMFVAALIKMIMLACTCVFFRKKTIVWLCVFGYMLFFYWYGFSLMRQSLALSVCLYSLTYLYEKKYIAFTVCMLIAYSFHNSAIFFLCILPVVMLAKYKNRLMYVAIGVSLIYIFASAIFSYISSGFLFDESKKDIYLDSGVVLAKSNIVIFVAFIFLTYFCRNKNGLMLYYIRAFSIVGLMFLFLSNLFEVAFRVSFYQMILLLFLVPMLIRTENNRYHVFLCNLIWISLFIMHMVVNANHGMADTIPYKSMIFSVLV